MYRRTFLLSTVAGALGTAGCAAPPPADAPAFRQACAALEARARGRLGVHVHDTASGRAWGWRADERFPMASTFKALLAAQVLAAVDGGREQLDARVTYGAAALVAYSPVTEGYAGEGAGAGAGGLTVAQLCEAAVTVSDNTAANLLLARHGGPAGLTAFLRRTGDTVTRLDRDEPTLKEALPGDPRDTTSPRAMADSLRRLALADALSPASRAQLRAWLLATRTGAARLRAGVPAGWQVAHKTGSGRLGALGDVGLLWPPGGAAPVVVACYLHDTAAPEDVCEGVIADVARLAVRGSAAARAGGLPG